MEQLTYLLEEYFLSGKSQQYGLPTVAWCADNLHISPNYFGDLVKKYSGHSAQEYIKSTIIDYAKILLANNSYQVNEIAYKLGFKYPQHFSRLFKQREGLSPSQYRATYNKKADNNMLAAFCLLCNFCFMHQCLRSVHSSR